MRILSYLNVSNGGDLERDSGFLFQRALLEELSSRHDVELVAPAGTARLLDRVPTIELDWPETKYGVRYGWSWGELVAAMRSRQPPDVVLNNQCELTAPMRLLLFEVFGAAIPVVTYFHYLAVLERDGARLFDPSLDDLGSARVTWDRQIEAARMSAASIIGTEYGAAFLREGLGRSVDGVDLTVIPPPVIPGLWAGADGAHTILYNHRLYGHYGTASTMRALERVCAATGSTVIVTDPTQGRSSSRASLDGGPAEAAAALRAAPWAQLVDTSTWTSYAEVVARATIGMAPDRPGALWSMSAMDLMSIGRPVLVPERSGLGQEIGRDLCFSNSHELEQKMVHLLRDATARAAAGRRCHRFADQFRVELIASRFEQVFERVLSGRMATSARSGSRAPDQ